MRSSTSLLVTVFALPVLACRDTLAPTNVASAHEMPTAQFEAAESLPAPIVSRAAAPTVDEAMRLLADAKRFESSGLGVGAFPSRYVQAWKQLRSTSDADAQFKRLWAAARTPEGRLYAIAGFYYTDRAAMRRLSRTAEWRGIDIETQFGCIGGRLPAVVVIEQVVERVWPRDFGDRHLPAPRL